MQLHSFLPCVALALFSLLVGDVRQTQRPDLDYDGSTIAMIDVDDLEAGQRFYEEVLGLERYFAIEEFGWAELKLPTQNAVLGLSVVEVVHKRASASFSLGVRDLADVHTRLVEAGVKFVEEPYEIEGLVKLATFEDPWGNQVMLHQSLTPAGQ